MSIFKELNETAKDPIVESDDDIIVGGMGRTGVLKEFYRLNEEEDKLRVFALFNVDDNGRRRDNALPNAVISVPATANRKDDEQAARKIGKEINPDFGTGFYDYEDTNAGSFSEELSDAKDRLNRIKHIIELVNHRSKNAGVKAIREGKVLRIINEAKKSNDQQFDDTKKVLLAKLADAYIKMAQREARDEIKGMTNPGKDDTVQSWTEEFIGSWITDVKELLPQEFEAAVKKLWK